MVPTQKRPGDTDTNCSRLISRVLPSVVFHQFQVGEGTNKVMARIIKLDTIMTLKAG